LSTLGATFKELTDKKYLKKMIHLLIPMALAGVLTSSLQIVDTLMIATLGDVPVAGVGLANRLTYFLSFLFASVTSGVSIYSAQFWGEKNQKGLRQCLSFAMMLILPIAVVFSLISIFAPHLVMRIFSQDEAVIEAGCTYLRFIAPAYLFQSVTALLAALLKATERPSLPMTASAAGIALNIVLNYILIFGKFGAPQMGVKGAAVATLIAAVLEMVLLIVFARLRKAQVALRKADFCKPEKAFIQKYIKTTVPIFFNEIGWSLAVITMTWVYSTLGTAAAAAATVYETIKSFVVVCCVSIGNAGAILVGIELGAGRLDEAEKNARRMLLGGLLVALCLVPVFLVLIDPLLTLYKEMSQEALKNLRGMLIALSCLFWIKMLNYNLINGILRAGGDTKAAACIDVLTNWCIAVPIIFVTGYLLKWPIIYVFPFTFLAEGVATLLSFIRYKKGYWKKKLA